MYKQMKKCNKNNGITLIALVLTIIVLLILAGVALSLALGQNELVFKSRKSKQEQEIAQEKDRIMTAYGASFANDKGEFKKDIFEQELRKQGIKLDGEINVEENGKLLKFKTKHNGYIIEDGRIISEQIGPNNNSSTNNTIPADLKVGDTIIYDPTKGVPDQNLLTYTSEASKNGYGEQTITATSNHKEWVVISTSGRQVKMMSKETIDGIEGGKSGGFTLEGGKGYLYAEEELHRMCSVFGHGKGAGKITTKYTAGNPYIGEAEERTLSGSGARSLILSDIVSVIKGEGQDFTDEEKKSFNSSYKTSVSSEVYYPTKVSTKESRESDDKKSFTQDYYSISKEEYTNYAKSETKTAREALVNSIFKEQNYWYASRYVYVYSSDAIFCVGNVLSSNVDAYDLFWRLFRFRRCEFVVVWPKTCGILRWKHARESKYRRVEDKRLRINVLKQIDKLSLVNCNLKCNTLKLQFTYIIQYYKNIKIILIKILILINILKA